MDPAKKIRGFSILDFSTLFFSFCLGVWWEEEVMVLG